MGNRRSSAVAPDWQSGDVSLTRIVESEEPLLSPFELLPDCTPQHIDRNANWLIPRFYNPERTLLVISIQGFLVRAGGKTILVDACSGNHKRRRRPFFHERNWDWLEKLRLAGAAPEDIDVVMCSHLHVDHIGWNTRLENGRWVPTFPRARYLVSRKEWEYWRSEVGIASLSRTGDFIADSALPIFESGQLDLIDDRHGFSQCINIEPIPGHTPGQYLVRLWSHSGEAVLTADLMHTPLQLRYPEWSTRFCVDPIQARSTRLRFLAEYCDKEALIFPSHFPTPTGGYIRREYEHYRFEFADSARG